MFLKEIMSQPATISWKKSESHWIGRFKVKDIDYIIEFSTTPVEVNDEHKNIKGWEIYFSTKNKQDTQKRDTYDLVGGKENQFIVFATVIEGIKKFLKSVKPEAFLFASYAKKMTSIYKNLIERFASQFGYSLIRVEAWGSRRSGGATFAFIRKGLERKIKHVPKRNPISAS